MTAEPEFPPQPQPQQPSQPQPLTPAEEKTWATITHAVAAGAMILSAGTVGFVVALVIYLVYRDRGPFIRAHAASAVNIQLTALIGVVICIFFFWLIFPLFLIAVIVVAAVVLHIIAALRANDGQWYDPPLTIRFVR